MKFDVVVGNPPYQENNDNSNRDEAIYPYFYNLAEQSAEIYCLVSPARFLFNMGSTSRLWNEKMLKDEHLKVVYFNHNSIEVFHNTDIKGGVAILYRDRNREFGAIDTFTAFVELNAISNKVKKKSNISFSELLYGNSSYKLTDKVYEDYSWLEGRVTRAEKKSLGSNAFERFFEIFSDRQLNDNQIQIYGREKNERIYKYVNSEYIQDGGNLFGYKVFVPGANGSGKMGEVLSTPVIGKPLIGHTQTFISFGNFGTEYEALSCLKYLKTKFSRAMLGVKKITQNNKTKETWSFVPLQVFTRESDIDWNKSIPEIDQQLYKKYGLSPEEIDFIESKVKAMD